MFPWITDYLMLIDLSWLWAIGAPGGMEHLADPPGRARLQEVLFHPDIHLSLTEKSIPVLDPGEYRPTVPLIFLHQRVR
jgi:hypothetical protein